MTDEEFDCLGTPIKYPFRIGVEKIDFFDEETRLRFRNDFDEVYNVFLVELGDLLFKWHVKHIDSSVIEDDLQEYLLSSVNSAN